MKKTILGVVVITMLLVAMLGVTVNAAALTANKEGDIVTVTVTTNEKVESMEFVMNFESSKFEFIEGSIKSGLTTIDSNPLGDGKLMVSAFGGEASTLTLQFKANGNVGGSFTLSDTEFSNDEAVSNPTAVVEATVIPEEPEKPNPGEEQKPGENVENKDTQTGKEENKKAENAEEYVDEDGKKITKIPQTGTYMPTVILGMSVLGIAFMAGYKMIKNK